MVPFIRANNFVIAEMDPIVGFVNTKVRLRYGVLQESHNVTQPLMTYSILAAEMKIFITK